MSNFINCGVIASRVKIIAKVVQFFFFFATRCMPGMLKPSQSRIWFVALFQMTVITTSLEPRIFICKFKDSYDVLHICKRNKSIYKGSR